MNKTILVTLVRTQNAISVLMDNKYPVLDVPLTFTMSQSQDHVFVSLDSSLLTLHVKIVMKEVLDATTVLTMMVKMELLPIMLLFLLVYNVTIQ